MDRAIVAAAWALALSLVHGALLAGFAVLALHALRDADAASRCRVTAAALFAVPVLFVTTWVALSLTDTTTAAAAGPLAGLVPAAGSVVPTVMPAWLVTLAWAVATAWLAATVVLLVRLADSARRVTHLGRSGAPASSPVLLRLFADAARNAHAGSVRLRCSPLVDVPTVVGVCPPILLLPVGIERSLGDAELKLLIAHELAHVARRDYAVNFAQTLLDAFFFFHPAVRWLSERLRIEREVACDEAALRSGRAVTLARALERLEALRAPAPFSIAATSGPLLHRVLRMLSARRELPRAHRFAVAALTPACGALLAVLTFTALPPDLVGTTLRAAAPAARFAQHVTARDDAGEFTLSIVGLRAVAATLAGQPVPPEHIVQRRDSVHLLAASGATLLSVHVRATGGFTWTSRAPEPARP